MKLAIMQPYFFPYIGYFQLINSVNNFLIYDDVNFIKNGWINRNRIVSKATGNKPVYFGLKLNGASSFSKIKDIEVNKSEFEKRKLLKKIENCYKKSPKYALIYPIFEEVLSTNSNKISAINLCGIKKVCDYLEIETNIISTSEGIGSDDLSGEQRVIDICKKLNSNYYVNAIGGKSLYNQYEFNKHNISLNFIDTKKIDYQWWNLSILHILMNFEKKEIINMLNMYNLIE